MISWDGTKQNEDAKGTIGADEKGRLEPLRRARNRGSEKKMRKVKSGLSAKKRVRGKVGPLHGRAQGKLERATRSKKGYRYSDQGSCRGGANSPKKDVERDSRLARGPPNASVNEKRITKSVATDCSATTNRRGRRETNAPHRRARNEQKVGVRESSHQGEKHPGVKARGTLTQSLANGEKLVGRGAGLHRPFKNSSRRWDRLHV